MRALQQQHIRDEGAFALPADDQRIDLEFLDAAGMIEHEGGDLQNRVDRRS